MQHFWGKMLLIIQIGMWMQGEFIVDKEKCENIYVLYSYVDGKLEQLLRCKLSSYEDVDCTRGMYIGEYIYIYILLIQ